MGYERRRVYASDIGIATPVSPPSSLARERPIAWRIQAMSTRMEMGVVIERD